MWRRHERMRGKKAEERDKEGGGDRMKNEIVNGVMKNVSQLLG